MHPTLLPTDNYKPLKISSLLQFCSNSVRWRAAKQRKYERSPSNLHKFWDPRFFESFIDRGLLDRLAMIEMLSKSTDHQFESVWEKELELFSKVRRLFNSSNIDFSKLNDRNCNWRLNSIKIIFVGLFSFAGLNSNSFHSFRHSTLFSILQEVTNRWLRWWVFHESRRWIIHEFLSRPWSFEWFIYD